jgi:uncharacterized protein (TIGR02271 family)
MSNMTPNDTIPVIEEEARIKKSLVETGKVRVQTVTELHEESVTASLEETSVEVKTVEVNKIVDHPPTTRTEGDTLIVPILEEVLVVEKRLLLKAELHVRRHIVNEIVEVPITLRKQRAVVQRLDPNGQPKTERGEQ